VNGIYIHIPYCKSKCNYCDFYSVIRKPDVDGFRDIVILELSMRVNYMASHKVDTVYFGGGTPSLLPPSWYVSVLKHIRERFSVDPMAEITLEANPDDLDQDLLLDLKGIGINRLSIGIQSFVDEHLTLMNRRHDAGQAERSVRLASGAGFGHISLDLIYGIPGMTIGQWEENVRKAISLPVDHISAYHLSIEPGTRFSAWKRKGILKEISDDSSFEQYELLRKILEDSGFRHYEISNFFRDEGISRHNSKYWTGEPYLGIGPSAHSFNGRERNWNPSSLKKWITQVTCREDPEGEVLTPWMRRNETIMVGLRTDDGLDLTKFRRIFGMKEQVLLLEQAQPHIDLGDLMLTGDRLLFNRAAWFWSDGILADLFSE